MTACVRSEWRQAGAVALAVMAMMPMAGQSAAPVAGIGASVSQGAAGGIASLVRQRLQLTAVLNGQFEQSKTLQGFRNPLVSHGEFLVARGQGVWWHTQQPFESTLVVTKTALFTRGAGGSTDNVMDAQAEPGLRQVNELVFSLLAGDLDALADRFEIQGQAVGGLGWTVTLVPRDVNIAKFMRSATLTGDRVLQSVRIEEAHGDLTQIRFSHQVPSATLSAADAARFK